MTVLFYSIISVLLISLVSLVGVAAFFFKERVLNRILLFFISFSAGSLMGGAFFHLLPEVLDEGVRPLEIFVYVLVGFSLFFILEKFLRWRHCHDSDCAKHHHLGWMNLIGDGVHNLIDGLIVFSAFTLGPQLGVPVMVSIILHEVPQEFSDFGVLVYSGFSRLRALAYNLLSALASVLGVFIAYFLVGLDQSINDLLLPLAAGGFIYIAASDLIPELHKERKFFNSLVSFLFFLLALIFMFAIKFLLE
ncbi:MAG: ZIP family metal transporter [Patescibacteria group bacterium]